MKTSLGQLSVKYTWSDIPEIM